MSNSLQGIQKEFALIYNPSIPDYLFTYASQESKVYTFELTASKYQGTFYKLYTQGGHCCCKGTPLQSVVFGGGAYVCTQLDQTQASGWHNWFQSDAWV